MLLLACWLRLVLPLAVGCVQAVFFRPMQCWGHTMCCLHPILLRLPALKPPLLCSPTCAEFHFDDRGQIRKHSVDCVQYSGMQLQLPLLARMATKQRAMVPGLAGGSFDEC